MIAIVILHFLLICGLGFLLYRASRALLQFDSLFQGIVETLEGYSDDLTKMSSADIAGVLADHPEVAAFHMRNMRARADVRAHLEEVRKSRPSRRKAPTLPRPDAE